MEKNEMTLKEKYDANMEFRSKLRHYCENHICKQNAPSNAPECRFSPYFTPHQCDLSNCVIGWIGKISFDNFKKIMEYKPPVDWSKVPVDTKIYVKTKENNQWERRHFSHYTPDGTVHAFCFGTTSFTADNGTSPWGYAKLAEVEDTE